MRRCRWRGDTRSQRVEAHADYLLRLHRREPDLTLAEIRTRLERRRGEKVSPSMIWRFFDRHDITFKKSRRTRANRTGPTFLEQRRRWFDGQLDLDPLKLVFVDETAATTNMARRYSRRRRGRRLAAAFRTTIHQSDHLRLRPAPERRRRAQGL